MSGPAACSQSIPVVKSLAVVRLNRAFLAVEAFPKPRSRQCPHPAQLMSADPVPGSVAVAGTTVGEVTESVVVSPQSQGDETRGASNDRT
jgi:hypothetical protein